MIRLLTKKRKKETTFFLYAKGDGKEKYKGTAEPGERKRER